MDMKKVLLIIATVLALQACNNKSSFLTSTVVPAAEGTVKIKSDKNNNYVIDLEVIRLAEPGRLNPPKDIYIVWMETDQNGVKNIGQLKTSSGFMSKMLKSSLETVTPYKPRRIIITAEDDAHLQYPGSQVVLRTGDL
jgi:hypothetical protein